MFAHDLAPFQASKMVKHLSREAVERYYKKLRKVIIPHTDFKMGVGATIFSGPSFGDEDDDDREHQRIKRMQVDETVIGKKR